MRTPSGTLHVVDFKTNQTIAAIQPKDYWDDKRHWEIKNNVDTLEFKVFDKTRNSIALMQQNLVLKEVRDGRIVPYVITEVEKDSEDRSVTAYASGEWVQLAKAGYIPPQKLEGKTINEFIDIALVGTKWKRGRTEYSSFRSMTIDEFIDPLSLLKKIASLFEMEIQYRAEVVGSKIVARYVDMVVKRGRDTGKEVTLGKDLIGIKRIENSQNICTALLGFVKKEGSDFITIADINKGVPYLVDDDAYQRWNEDGVHKFGFYSPETESKDMDPNRLLTLMKTEMKKRINTSVSYEVSAHSIGRIFGMSHELIYEGDTLRIKDTGFTPQLFLVARAISGDESFTDPSKDKYTFGDYVEIIDTREELRKLYNKLRDSLYDKADTDALKELETQLEETSNGFDERLIAMKTSLEETDAAIILNAQAVNQQMEKLSSDFSVTAKEVSSKVTKGEIISTINQTAEQITIDVAKLDINADTIVDWLTAEGIDTNFISVRGDKITIDKKGVTVKMLDFLYEDERGTKTTVMSKRNLIADHDFSSVTKKNIGHNDYSGFDSGYGLPWRANGNVIIEKNTPVFNYEQMVNATRVDMYNYPETTVKNGIHPGGVYTLSAHFRCATINGNRVTARPQLHVCYVTYRDSVRYDIWQESKLSFDAPSIYFGDIQRRSFTFTVPNNYNSQEHAVVIKVESSDANIGQGTAICVSGITLVSGKYASMYDWNRASAERVDGLQPFNSISIGGINNNIGPAADGQTFDINTEKDVRINQPILTQGINLGRNKMGQVGSVRFFDGGQGYGFYFMGMGGTWYKLPNV
ncbi:phage tail spike protein [Bacillus hominis]|uniref:Phage tail spike protein n=1 Tax=Bacillus hominis TaxID=2817478 RepID=A0ABT7RA84_9BACI|nr:phage tail spike protein [Bacillus hominis]MDM5439843.1 phage tail spike protein [Bacillus hominis]